MKKTLFKLTAVLMLFTSVVACMEHCPMDEEMPIEKKPKKVMSLRTYIIYDTDSLEIEYLKLNPEGEVTEWRFLNEKEENHTLRFKREKDTLYITDKNTIIKLAYDNQNRIIYKYYHYKPEGFTRQNLFEYDDKGNLIVSKSDYRRPGMGFSDITHYTYDSKGRIISERERGGGAIYYKYDERDRVISITHKGENTKDQLFAAVIKYNDAKYNFANHIRTNKKYNYIPFDEYFQKNGTIMEYYLINLESFMSTPIRRYGLTGLYGFSTLTGEEKEVKFNHDVMGEVTLTSEFEYDEEGAWTKAVIKNGGEIVVEAPIYREVKYYE